MNELKISLLLLTLHEGVFYSGSEIHRSYLTPPVIGNYALVYAFCWAKAPYIWNPKPLYNDPIYGIKILTSYITPATPIGIPKYRNENFNAIQPVKFEDRILGTESYRIQMMQSNLAGNYPQLGQFQMLAPGDQFLAVAFNAPKLFPYIRLGKFLSKVKVEELKIETVELIEMPTKNKKCSIYLNPLDLPKNIRLQPPFTTLSIHPVPLIRDVKWEGKGWEIVPGNSDLDTIYVPNEMHFLQEYNATKENNQPRIFAQNKNLTDYL